MSPTGVLTFDPAPGQVGVATITLTLSDNGVPVATSAAQTFTITITDVNDAPSFTVPANAPAVNERSSWSALSRAAGGWWRSVRWAS